MHLRMFINLDKWKVITTNASNDRSDIKVKRFDVELVSDFSYLDSYITYNSSCEKGIKVHMNN